MSASPAIVGIVLAAGGSSRMGRPKALLPLDGEPLITRHLDALRHHCGGLRVVTGAHDALLRPVLPADVMQLWNSDWQHTGPRESLLLALEDLDEETTALVTPVDAPPAPAWILRMILAAGAPVVPRHQRQDGHPVLVRVGPTRRALATSTLRDALVCASRLDVDWADCAMNLNTPAEWRDWLTTRRDA